MRREDQSRWVGLGLLVVGMVAGLITLGVVGINMVFPGSTDITEEEGRSTPSERIYVYDAFGQEHVTPRIVALEAAGDRPTFSEAYDVPGGVGMAPSPDGLLLYIVRVTGGDGSFEGVLETLDTATGRIVHSASLSHPFSTSSGSSMSPAVSPEGRWVYVLKSSRTGETTLCSLTTPMRVPSHQRSCGLTGVAR